MVSDDVFLQGIGDIITALKLHDDTQREILHQLEDLNESMESIDSQLEGLDEALEAIIEIQSQRLETAQAAESRRRESN